MRGHDCEIRHSMRVYVIGCKREFGDRSFVVSFRASLSGISLFLHEWGTDWGSSSFLPIRILVTSSSSWSLLDYHPDAPSPSYTHRFVTHWSRALGSLSFCICSIFFPLSHYAISLSLSLLSSWSYESLLSRHNRGRERIECLEWGNDVIDSFSFSHY